MAIIYNDFFDVAKTYAEAYKKTLLNKGEIDVIVEYAISKLTDAEDSTRLQGTLQTTDQWKANETSFGSALGNSQMSAFMTNQGKLTIQSTGNSGAAVAADLVSFMDRDAQTVLENAIGESSVVTGSGDGAATVAQSQQTKNDTITCTVTTAQNGGDAVFSVVSTAEGSLGTLTADGASTIASALAGIISLSITAGSVGNEWALDDQILITTTSDDVSILLITFRDFFNVLLPNAAISTITNTLDP